MRYLKSKKDSSVSFVNPAYEDDEGGALLPVDREDLERVKELEKEIEEFDKAIADQDAKVRNSLQRLQNSIENFIDSKDDIRSRIKELFRREGVTIASIITAVGMTIAAIVEGIKLALKKAVSAVTPKPDPPKPKPKPDPKPDPPKPDPPKPDPPKPPKPPPEPKTWTDWVKDQLQKIANLLLKLGDKALIALPGIIGAVLNFVLKTAASVTGFLADHLVAFALLIGGLLYTSVNEFYENKKKK